MKALKFSILLLSALFFSLSGLSAQLEIEVEIDDYPGDTIYLGYYYANKQYFRDTAVLQNGEFTFQSEENIPEGLYLLYDPLSRKYHDLIIGSDQEFEVSTDTSFSMKEVSFSGSDENSDFYDYIRYLSEVKSEAQKLQEKMPDPKAEKKLDEINQKVKKMQDEIVEKYESSISGLIVLNTREPDIPEFDGTEQEVKQKRFQYYKNHYFDHLDLTDERLMRTPFFYGKIDQYVTQVSPQMPDSIMVALDRVLLPMHEENPDAFRFFLSHFLNKYAKSKIVGLDAVYVHLAQNYYGQGLADWVGEETLSKILDEAQKKSTVLIGKSAPDISLLRLPSNEKLQLYDIESPYTVLYFWDPDCGHCKKQTPDVISFYKDYKDKGVEVVAICTKLNKDAEQECLKSIDDKEDMEILTNAYDPFLRSRYKQKYDIRSTPRIYILDREKKIVMKGISGNKLSEVMDHVMKNQDKS